MKHIEIGYKVVTGECCMPYVLKPTTPDEGTAEGNFELREDYSTPPLFATQQGGGYELREDGSYELRE
jgi:hypothetical protein